MKEETWAQRRPMTPEETSSGREKILIAGGEEEKGMKHDESALQRTQVCVLQEVTPHILQLVL